MISPVRNDELHTLQKWLIVDSDVVIQIFEQALRVTFILSFVCLFVFIALRPKSTAMVIAGRSVHLTTLFLGQA